MTAVNKCLVFAGGVILLWLVAISVKLVHHGERAASPKLAHDEVHDADANVHVIAKRAKPLNARAAAVHASAIAGALFHSNKGIEPGLEGPDGLHAGERGWTAQDQMDSWLQKRNKQSKHKVIDDDDDDATDNRGSRSLTAGASMLGREGGAGGTAVAPAAPQPLKLFIICLSSQTDKSRIARTNVYVT